MVNCSACGEPVPDNVLNCPSCGTRIKGSLTGEISRFVDNKVVPQGIAPVMAKNVKVTNILGLIVVLVILVFEIIFFTFAVMSGLPLYIAGLFIAMTFVIMSFILYSSHRIKKVDFSNPKEEYVKDLQNAYGGKSVNEIHGTRLFGDSPVKLDSGEKVIASLAPVYRLQTSYSGPSGVSAEKYTENTIILTDKRIIFITIPLPGQGLIISGGSQDMWNDMLKRNTIKELALKALDLLKNGDTLDHFPNDYWINRDAIQQSEYLKSIGPTKFAWAGAMGFKVIDSKKLRYSIVDSIALDTLINELHPVKKYVI
jgi:hypothetical protein